MLTSMSLKKYGVNWNKYRLRRGLIKHKTRLKYARERDLRTAIFVGKGKLRHLNRLLYVDHFEKAGARSRELAARKINSHLLPQILHMRPWLQAVPQCYLWCWPSLFQ